MRHPIFVGGTGRSGSTVVGYLLGAHPEIWATTPREIRFITDRGGLLDLVYGARTRESVPLPSLPGPRPKAAWLRARVRQRNSNGIPTSMDSFVRRLRGEWWERRSPDGEPRGLHRGLDADEAENAVRQFVATFRGGDDVAASTLVHELMYPPTSRAHRRTWADTTPQNAENAHRIVQLLPDAGIVYVIRDGRDTAASVLRKAWGPNDWFTALEWWRIGALKAHRSMRRIEHGITIQLEALVRDARQETLHRLFHGLGLEVTTEVREYFDARVRPDRAHIGRWQDEIPEHARASFDRRYQRIWKELTEAGLPLPPLR